MQNNSMIVHNMYTHLTLVKNCALKFDTHLTIIIEFANYITHPSMNAFDSKKNGQ